MTYKGISRGPSHTVIQIHNFTAEVICLIYAKRLILAFNLLNKAVGFYWLAGSPQEGAALRAFIQTIWKLAGSTGSNTSSSELLIYLLLFLGYGLISSTVSDYILHTHMFDVEIMITDHDNNGGKIW